MRLLVISHPEVIVDPEVPITSWPLSATGRTRAKTFAHGTEVQMVTRIVSSPEVKAHQTARILADALGLTVTGAS